MKLVKPTKQELKELLANKRICAECKHYKYTLRMAWGKTEPICTRVNNRKIDLVTGKIIADTVYSTCKQERYYDDLCSDEGIHWVPKKETPDNLIKLLKGT